MKNTDSRVFDPAAIDTSAICHVKLHSSAGRFMRYTTDTSHRPNGWPRFNADPIVKHEEFRGTCAPRASTCTNCSCGCGCPDLPDLRIKLTAIFLSESPSPSLSNYIILSIESLLDTVCLPKIIYRLFIYFYLKRQNYFLLIHRQKKLISEHFKFRSYD